MLREKLKINYNRSKKKKFTGYRNGLTTNNLTNKQTKYETFKKKNL